MLDEVRPGLDTAKAEIIVNAMLTTVDDAARTGRLGERPDIADRLVDLGTVLPLDEGESTG
ncbi:hypothetical protein OHA88_39915 [Streptomyces sp. NBC_00353]|uniref:hypothetical protein n=1 Tax=Streptomyces sp. NBC_00353 TaxID=2975722 RepID=UPI002E267896